MPTQTGSGAWIADGVHKETWPALANGDFGTPLSAPTLPIKTAQVTGTFGASGSVSLEGSNDGVNYVVIKDVANAAATLTAAGVITIRDNPMYIRPHVTVGDGTTALVVSIVSKSYSD